MITSTSSSQVKHVVTLQKKARARREFKEYVVEGIKMVSEVPKDMLVKVYQSETFSKVNPFFASTYNIEEKYLETVSDHVFMQMSDTQTPQGILAVAAMPEYSISDINKENAFIIVLENLQDPGNLGTIIRMGEAAGVTGIVMSSNTVDIYNPKTIRSTMGSIYRVPFIYAVDLKETVEKLKKSGVAVYAAHLEGSSEYTAFDYTKKTAFLIGNEGNGLTPELTKAADKRVRIPMQGSVESLNAAMACTILSYEAVRQRNCK